MWKIHTLLSSPFIARVFATSEATTIDASTIMDILTTITGQFSVGNIVGMLAGLLAISVPFVFLWWGIRKGSKSAIRAVTKGKFSV